MSSAASPIKTEPGTEELLLNDQERNQPLMTVIDVHLSIYYDRDSGVGPHLDGFKLDNF